MERKPSLRKWTKSFNLYAFILKGLKAYFYLTLHAKMAILYLQKEDPKK